MTPEQLAKSGTEHGEQAAVFAWAAIARHHGLDAADAWALQGRPIPTVPIEPCDALEWLHAIPNGGSRGSDPTERRIRGGAMKAEGVKSGIADIFLPYPVHKMTKDGYGTEMAYAGLYIELKRESLRPKKATSKGAASYVQTEFGKYAKSVGYGFAVCYGWREAIGIVRSYLTWKG